MANHNAKYPIIAAQDDSSGVSVYDNALNLGALVSVNGKYSYNEVDLPGDGEIQESDYRINGGTVTVNTHAMVMAVQAYLRGHSADGTGYTVNNADAAPYVGFGFYGQSSANAGLPWKVVFFYKVLFKGSDDEAETDKPGSGPTYKTPSIEGKLYCDKAGNLLDRRFFATEAEAKAWLEAKTQFVATAVAPTSNVASGSYTAAKTVVLSTEEDGGTIYYTDDGTVPTEDNGTEYTVGIVCAKPSNTCIKAVTVVDGKADSMVLELLIVVTA